MCSTAVIAIAFTATPSASVIEPATMILETASPFALTLSSTIVDKIGVAAGLILEQSLTE